MQLPSRSMVTFDPDRVDLPLLLAVRDIRREFFACTHAQVAVHLGISKASAQDRIGAAVKRGHLKQSSLRGSVTIGDSIGMGHLHLIHDYDVIVRELDDGTILGVALL